MESYFAGLTEQMPMCENMHGGTKKHLPAWMTRQFVFEQYIEEMSTRGEGNVLVNCIYPYPYTIQLPVG
jgi:hypothetical protein